MKTATHTQAATPYGQSPVSAWGTTPCRSTGRHGYVCNYTGWTRNGRISLGPARKVRERQKLAAGAAPSYEHLPPPGAPRSKRRKTATTALRAKPLGGNKLAMRSRIRKPGRPPDDRPAACPNSDRSHRPNYVIYDRTRKIKKKGGGAVSSAELAVFCHQLLLRPAARSTKRKPKRRALRRSHTP